MSSYWGKTIDDERKEVVPLPAMTENNIAFCVFMFSSNVFYEGFTEV